MTSAYIAASRRSDRSLEARVESARRASEIHKRRTGRSLRVTEQDVVNEEMYEEEDDDLPMQYRRLTAHLQTGSADFNRRLSAYLTNHVAMRTALDQAITNSYAQQYPNAPQFAHNQSVYPSPFMNQSMSPQQSPQSYGQPYPTPASSGYRPGHRARPASASASNSTPAYSPSVSAASPGQPAPQMDPRRTASASKSASRSPTGSSSTPQLTQSRPSLPHSSSGYIKQEDQPRQMRAPPQPSSQQNPFRNMHLYPNNSPFTTALPAETQMLLGSALDPNDPMTSMLMAGSENLPMPFNYLNSSLLQKPHSFHQSFDGMSATLAPSALDMSPRQHDYTHPPSSMSMSNSQLGYSDSLPDFSKSQMFTPGSATGSGTDTPGGIDGGWDSFINDNSWTENVT